MTDKVKPVVSKSLVRNAEIPVPPTMLVPQELQNYVGKELEVREKRQNGDLKQQQETVSLSEPALNTALRIVKQMKQTSDMKPSRISCASNVTRDFSEKVAKKMNFPYNEHLYHDLVAINLSDIPESECVTTTKMKPHKRDRSPDLMKFLNPSFVSDIPVIVNHNFSHHTNQPVWDGHEVYLSTEKVIHDCLT